MRQMGIRTFRGLAAFVAAGLIGLGGLVSPAFAQDGAGDKKDPLVFYGFRAERAEIRFGEGGEEVLALDADAFVGTDELKLFWRGEWEYVEDEDEFEAFENQIRLQTPITRFFDVVAGVRYDAPQGPNRIDGVIGLHGLAPQWFEADFDLFISDDPVFRVELDYEGLITNRITLTPSIEIDVPLTDDAENEFGAFAPVIEVGARLSYDLIDRAVSPFIGVHYEVALGESGDLTRAEGGAKDEVFFVLGAKLLF